MTKMNCTAHDITWHGLGAQCLNCGAKAETAFTIRHILSPRQREDRYVFSLGTGSTRMTSMVDAKGRIIE